MGQGVPRDQKGCLWPNGTLWVEDKASNLYVDDKVKRWMVIILQGPRMLGLITTILYPKGSHSSFELELCLIL